MKKEPKGSFFVSGASIAAVDPGIVSVMAYIGRAVFEESVHGF
ncbi:hypothetical protein [Tianweitania populi]|nr:hypothetical protein [Tianweitania populi]